MPEFELLCDELHLTTELEDQAQLERLEGWWKTNVSNDISFSGTPREEYKFYLNEAKRYLNIFLLKKFTHMSDIQYAALHGYDIYLEKLNESTEAFNLADKDGMTPLHWAGFKGHIQTARTLLEKGASPSSLNKHAQMPLHSTLLVPIRKSERLFSNKENIFKMLVEHSPETINNQEHHGDSIFHLIASDDHFHHLLEQSIVKNALTLSQPNKLKQYPIHIAILNNQITNTRVLLESILATENHSDRECRVPLHYAAKYGSIEMIQLCIAHSKDIDIRDTYNKTPLILAAERGNKEAVTVLLEHGADPTLIDCNKKNYQDYLSIRPQNSM